MDCVAVLVQALGIRFQRRSQRPAVQCLDRFRVGAVIKEVVEWSIHPTSIYGNGQPRLCRVSSVGTCENQGADEFTRHSPELGIVAELRISGETREVAGRPMASTTGEAGFGEK